MEVTPIFGLLHFSMQVMGCLVMARVATFHWATLNLGIKVLITADDTGGGHCRVHPGKGCGYVEHRLGVGVPAVIAPRIQKDLALSDAFTLPRISTILSIFVESRRFFSLIRGVCSFADSRWHRVGHRDIS